MKRTLTLMTVFALLMLYEYADILIENRNNSLAPPIQWMAYDIHGGMSYLYGVTVSDFGNGEQIAYADSFSALRAMNRKDDALIYLRDIRNGEQLIFTENMDFHPNPDSKTQKLIERMIAVDVNNNNHKDLVAVANSHNALLAYLNPGKSRKEWQRTVLTMDVPGAVNIAAVDPDNDDDSDIIIAMREQASDHEQISSGLAWMRNDGDGNWSFSKIPDSSVLKDPRAIVFINFPHESGGNVILSTDIDSGDTFLFSYQDDTWQKTRIENLVAPRSYYGLSIDITGDGLNEYFFGRGDGIYYADFSKSRTTPNITQIADFGSSEDAIVTEIKTGDIDGDNINEVVYSILGNGIYYSQKHGTKWLRHQISPYSMSYHSLELMDFDGDGRLDILAGIEYPFNSLQVWHNMGR